MSPLPSTFARNQPFEDKILDNKGFLEAMEEGLPLALSATEIQTAAEIQKQTRVELQELFAHMKKQKFIQWVTEWTALEQRNFFETVQKEVMNTGIIISTHIRKKIKPIIEDEIWREINDNVEKGQSMESENVPYRENWSIDTSFLSAKETSVIPLDLGLTIGRTETIVDARKKLDRYSGKYNALVLVDTENRPIWIVKTEVLERHEKMGSLILDGIEYMPEFISNVFWYYATTSSEVRDTMQENGINILPIVDSNTGILIGILTDATRARKELQYYATTSLTKLNLEVWMKMNM